jgi:hypothetical protein
MGTIYPGKLRNSPQTQMKKYFVPFLKNTRSTILTNQMRLPYTDSKASILIFKLVLSWKLKMHYNDVHGGRVPIYIGVVATILLSK